MPCNSVTVSHGDTLWSLAARHLGDPGKWPVLWHLNTGRIVAEQQRRGLQPYHPEDWIFPGTLLDLPKTDKACGTADKQATAPDQGKA